MKRPKGRGRNSRSRRLQRRRLQAGALAAVEASSRRIPNAKVELQPRLKSVARSFKPFSSVQCGSMSVSEIHESHNSVGPVTRAAQRRGAPAKVKSPAKELAIQKRIAFTGNTKRRATRPLEGACNEASSKRPFGKRPVLLTKGFRRAVGAHVGLAAGGRHMSATRSNLEARSFPMSIANSRLLETTTTTATTTATTTTTTTNGQPNNAEPVEADQQADESRNEMDFIKSASRAYSWHWNDNDRSDECIVSDDKLEVCFHPDCSESAAAIRGSQPLSRNRSYYYWEVTVLDKAYGTSVMFGVCTKKQKLHANDYCNLVGLDGEGWSLSHKGLIWHNTKMSPYTDTFPTNQTITLGILFNTVHGEISYFMNGKNLGIAFCGLNKTTSELYPVIGSTAKCTRIRLDGAYCSYKSLLERSCFTLLRSTQDKNELVKNLHQYQLPKNLIRYLAEAAEVCGSQTETTAQLDQYQLEC